MPITVTAAVIATELGATAAQADRLLIVATELVTHFAPAAPDAVLNEATLRVCGWLFQTPMGSIKSEAAGPVRISYATHEKNALRHSGAMSLLSPYKVRRAAVIR